MERIDWGKLYTIAGTLAIAGFLIFYWYGLGEYCAVSVKPWGVYMVVGIGFIGTFLFAGFFIATTMTLETRPGINLDEEIAQLTAQRDEARKYAEMIFSELEALRAESGIQEDDF